MTAIRTLTLLLAVSLGFAAFAAVPTNPPTPAEIDLSAAPASPLAAIEAIAKQSGLPFKIADTDATFARPFMLKRGSFWEAADAVAVASDRSLSFSTESGQLTLGSPRPKDVPALPVSHAGRFRVAGRRVVARADLDTGRSVTEVELDVWWEPRFRVYLFEPMPLTEKPVDDKGRPLTTLPVSGGRGSVNGFGHTLTIRLNKVPRDAERIATLRGEFGVVAAEHMLSASFADIGTEPVVWKKDDVTVTVTPPKKWRADDVVPMDVRVSYVRELPEFESFQSWVPANRCWLQRDGEAKPLAFYGYEIDRQSNTSVEATYRFKVPGSKTTGLRGWTFHYETPASIAAFTVPFTLKDVPLP